VFALCYRQLAVDDVGGGVCLLLATSVTVHLTHLVCHAIGTKMFLSHGNKVEVSTSEESGRRHLKIGRSFSHQIATAAAAAASTN